MMPPQRDLEWHLQELARRVMERPAERQRIIREYHAELVNAGDTFNANSILTVYAITGAQPDNPATMPERPKSRRLKIIATSYWNAAMPLVRYETGDSLMVPRSYDDSAVADVALGRRPFLRLEGREGEYLLTEDGVRIIGLNHIPRDLNNVLQLQLVQQDLGAVTINVVALPAFSKLDAGQILQQARAKIPASIEITLNVVDRLTLNAAGKAPFVLRMMN